MIHLKSDESFNVDFLHAVFKTSSSFHIKILYVWNMCFVSKTWSNHLLLMINVYSLIYFTCCKNNFTSLGFVEENNFWTVSFLLHFFSFYKFWNTLWERQFTVLFFQINIHLYLWLFSNYLTFQINLVSLNLDAFRKTELTEGSD